MEDYATASSSAHDAQNNRRQPRQRANEAAYSMPGDMPGDTPSLNTPRFAICNQYGPPLEPALRPLARALFALDFKLLQRVRAADRKHLNSADDARKIEANRRIGDFNEIQRQWKNINSNQSQFSQSYMQDPQFVPVWAEGLRIMKEALGSKSSSSNAIKKQSDFTDILIGYDSLACRLRDEMVGTAHQGHLEKEVLYSIQDRWIRLDEILDWYCDLYNRDLDEDTPPMSRSSPKWQAVRSSVQVNDPTPISYKKPIHIQPAGSTEANQSDITSGLLGGKTNGAFILWSTLFGCAVTCTAFFALGYAHSPHLQGTTNDADFWFLIQSTIVQLLGLVVSALIERKSGGLPKWRWALPTAIAGACSVIAIPLYLVVPTEWSSFLSLVAGATQSFMVLQHFLSWSAYG